LVLELLLLQCLLVFLRQPSWVLAKFAKLQINLLFLTQEQQQSEKLDLRLSLLLLQLAQIVREPFFPLEVQVSSKKMDSATFP
jgi:hypothetical protein